MLEKREFEQNDFRHRFFTAIAIVAGVFSFIVFALLVINYLLIENVDPVDDLMLTQLRQQYAALPQKDEALAERIQKLDLLTRKAFFTTQYHLRVGGILLLTGTCIFLIAFKYSLRWKREAPRLEVTPTHEAEFLAFAESRKLISWAGVAMLGLGLGATLLTESAVRNDPSNIAAAAATPTDAPAGGDAKAAAEAVAATPPPAWDAIEKNWPSFRGPGSNGLAHFTNAPTDWDVASGKNVKWKVETGLPGPNSPIIWENKLFLSGANDKEREIYCYDINDGKLLWKAAVEPQGTAPAAPPKVTEETGFAAPSMVVHGGQVFALFAEGDLVAYDLDGKKIWGKGLGVPENHYGHSSSLLAFDKFLYVQLDQKKDPKLIALDTATGKEAWVAMRKTISWASPILANTDFGPQLILNSETNVDAYNPISGELLWSQECLSGEVAPSPAFSKGVVLAANEYATATAIGIEKTGDKFEPKVLWEYDELLPEVSSPIGDGERFYFGTAGGILVCLDAKTGAKLWEHEGDEGFYSSPVLVGDRIYIADKAGLMYIIKAAPTFELIAKPAMGEQTFATPAFMDGRIYVRTAGHLYCIEQSNA